jgi:CoA:oxalate CoA-transferase
MLVYQASYYLLSGQVPGRQGREHDSIATYRTFKAKDGIELVIAALTERMWASLCRVLGCEELVGDARFAKAKDRSDNRAVLWPILEERFLARTADEWTVELDAAGVPVGVVNTVDRVAADPQLRHRGMVVELEAEDGRRVEVMGDPFFMQETRRRNHSFPPIAGENTSAILGELLGLGSEEIASLIDSGAVLSAGRTKAAPETD